MEKLRYEELKAGLRAYAEGLDGGRAEMVVESDALGGGGAEEKTSEENEGEGAHLAATLAVTPDEAWMG